MNVRLVCPLVWLFSLTLCGQAAAEEDRHVARALAIIEAGMPSPDAGRPFRYRAHKTVRPKASASYEIRAQWTVADDPHEGSVVCQTVSGTNQYFGIRDKGQQYIVTKAPGEPWLSSVEPALNYHFDTHDPIQWYLHPVFYDQTAREMLRRHEPMEATISADAIELLIPAVPQLAKLLQEGTVTGFPGWFFLFHRRGEAWILERVDRFEAAEVSKGGSTVRSDRILEQFGSREVLGMRCGITIRIEFSDFVDIGETTVPRHVLQTDFLGTTTSKIEEGSIELLSALDRSVFSMRPPPEFGTEGLHHDRIQGVEFVSVDHAKSETDLVDRMVTRGEASGGHVERERLSDWLIGCGIAIWVLLILYWGWGLVSRRRHERSGAE